MATIRGLRKSCIHVLPTQHLLMLGNSMHQTTSMTQLASARRKMHSAQPCQEKYSQLHGSGAEQHSLQSTSGMACRARCAAAQMTKMHTSSQASCPVLSAGLGRAAAEITLRPKDSRRAPASPACSPGPAHDFMIRAGVGTPVGSAADVVTAV